MMLSKIHSVIVFKALYKDYSLAFANADITFYSILSYTAKCSLYSVVLFWM